MKTILASLGGALAMLLVVATWQARTSASQFVATAPASPLRQSCDPYCPITKVSFTSVVSRNDYATLKVNVRPRARCTIKVVYSTGPSSAAGLRAKIGGLITWRWKVDSNTKLGRWPVIVNCGISGPSSRFTLRVVR